jgi:hypothetical protein
MVQLLQHFELMLQHPAMMGSLFYCLVYYLQGNLLVLFLINSCHNNAESSVTHNLNELVKLVEFVDGIAIVKLQLRDCRYAQLLHHLHF